jgi:glyoxylase I family protein
LLPILFRPTFGEADLKDCLGFIHICQTMIALNKVHHVAILSSDYEKSKAFYTTVLGLTVIHEEYREERQSYKADLSLNGEYIIELFSFPNPPKRVSRPEAAGLRHLAFEVDDLTTIVETLQKQHILAEAIRIDETTGKRFTFIFDPDNLPIEFYEK